MNYMVMECHPAYAVVLSEDGRFLKVANMRYQVGQTVSHVVEMELPPAKQPARRWISVLVSAAACLALVFGGWFMNYMPYASVYIAINPQVRIDVSRTDRVLAVAGVNADGEILLEGYDPQRKDLDLVMDELVDRAIDMGYLHQGGKIILTLDADEQWVAGHEERLNTHLADHLNEKISVTIDISGPGLPEKPAQEPAQTVPAPVSGGQAVQIPVSPETDYGESDYGTEPQEDSGYDDLDEEADSGYDDVQDGQTDYDPPEKESHYDAPEDPGTVYGESSYKKETPYHAPEKKEDSGYDDHDDHDDGGSGYEDSDEDSGYDDEDDDDDD